MSFICSVCDKARSGSPADDDDRVCRYCREGTTGTLELSADDIDKVRRALNVCTKPRAFVQLKAVLKVASKSRRRLERWQRKQV